VGFEPTNGGFADLSLGPLGYRAELFSITKTRMSVRARKNTLEEDLSLGGLFNSLQLFAGLETHGLSRWNVYLFTGARVAADSGFSRLHAENTKTPQFDALAAAERTFERLKNSFHSLLGFGAADIRRRYDGIYDVELDHMCLQRRLGRC
jgi:hypothetical protein